MKTLRIKTTTKRSSCEKAPEFFLHKKLFLKNECLDLINLATSQHTEQNGSTAGEDRKVSIWEVAAPKGSCYWKKISWLFESHNHWGFDIDRIKDPIWVQKYPRWGYTATHSDVDLSEKLHPKITAIVSLLPPSSWEGGILSVNQHPVPRMNQGDCVLFPSFAPHGVSKVTKGNRWIAAAWASGPPLR